MGIWKVTMKLIPVFLILLFFSGVLLLVYMTWATFSRRSEMGYLVGPESEFNHETSLLERNLGGGDSTYRHLSPQLKMNEGFLPNGLSSVDEVALFGDELMKSVERLRMRVVSNLRRRVLDGAKVVGHLNQYGVNFTKLRPRVKQNVEAMMCRIKRLKLDIVTERSSPVFKGKHFPSEPLFGEPSSRLGNRIMEKEFVLEQQGSSQDSGSDEGPIYRTCAVIPNSAALDGAQHGIDIDSHDFILRFNNAPTEEFEEDVGTLTSMRILNSQVVTKPQFLFPDSSYFDANKNNGGVDAEERKRKARLDALWASTRKYLVWDPCNFTSTVEMWEKKPDHPVFDKYFNLTSHPEKYGRNKFYLLNCRALWRLWELLHEFTFAKIYGNPPTSGFIGIALALQKCERVNVYEYIPSVRESARCHYYGPKNESNPSCTYGSWHPVSAEKLFFLGLTDSTDKQIFMDGVLSIPGVSKFKC